TAGQSGVCLRGRRWPADAGVAGRALAEGEPLVVDDYGRLDARIGGEETAGIRVGAAAPMVLERAVRGTLSIGTRHAERRFDQGELELLGVMADLIADAIARPGGPGELENVRGQLRALRTALDARDPDEYRRIAATAGIATRIATRLLPPDRRLHAELELAARLHD